MLITGYGESSTVYHIHRNPLYLLVIALFIGACGSETAMVERLAPAGPAAAVKPPVQAAPAAAPEPPPAASLSSLRLAGDFTVEDTDPDVVVEPLAGSADRDPRLRLELRHRTGGSSQPDAVVVFLNVPAKPGTYVLHAPEEPLLPVRVYAFVTTRGEALGSMKDFNTAVTGSLTLRREAPGLVGSFKVAAQEPPPPPPPEPLPGEAPRITVGTVPPAPPGRVEATGTLLAMLPADRSAPDAVSPASEEKAPAPASRSGGSRRASRDSSGRMAWLPPEAELDRRGG